MNEQKLKELKEQAWEYALSTVAPDGPNTNLVFQEKFADLIVGECLEVCSGVEYHYGKGNYNKVDVAIGAGICVDRLKQHFGVEE